MLDGVLSLIPGAKVSAVGVARNEETLEAHTYLEKLAPDINQRLALIIDPMLATGGSMVATIDLLKKAGCKEIRAMVLVAAPEGIEVVEKAHPDVKIYTASIDQRLNEHGYIVPGLGDAGDKIFGTKQRTPDHAGRLQRPALAPGRFGRADALRGIRRAGADAPDHRPRPKRRAVHQ